MTENKEVKKYEFIQNMENNEKSLKNGIANIKASIMPFACEEVKSWDDEKVSAFLDKISVLIATHTDSDKWFKSGEGQLSIVDVFQTCVSTGLIPDGNQMYLLNKNRNIKFKDEENIKRERYISEAKTSVKDRGYYAILCGGKRPVLADLSWGCMFTADAECSSIDEGTGEVNIVKKICADSGALVGVWVKAVKQNGKIDLKFYPMKKINQWRVKAKTQSIWNAWPEEMALQASIRHHCDRYFQGRELLSSAIYDGDIIPDKMESSVDRVNDMFMNDEAEMFDDDVDDVDNVVE